MQANSTSSSALALLGKNLEYIGIRELLDKHTRHRKSGREQA